MEERATAQHRGDFHVQSEIDKAVADSAYRPASQSNNVWWKGNPLAQKGNWTREKNQQYKNEIMSRSLFVHINTSVLSGAEITEECIFKTLTKKKINEDHIKTLYKVTHAIACIVLENKQLKSQYLKSFFIKEGELRGEPFEIYLSSRFSNPPAPTQRMKKMMTFEKFKKKWNPLLDKHGNINIKFA